MGRDYLRSNRSYNSQPHLSFFPKKKIAVLLSCLMIRLTPAPSALLFLPVSFALIKQMTLEEKVGQMAQVSIESLGNSKGQQFSFSEKMRDAVVNYKIGSILNSPGPLQPVNDWNRLITEM